ncbi:2OG-Fe(II) oxygenase [Leptospira sp. 96542]|nr:2OG-Fe(II) oxygenase [Leptospira sp. 96542]
MMKRQEIADLIVSRLESELVGLQAGFSASGPIQYFLLDHLLPDELALQIRKVFPQSGSMKIKRSLRELKFISAQMNQHDTLLEEALYAFQDHRVVRLINQITGLHDLEPDEQLYAGGISMMGKGHFLNPHLDNSHDKTRDRYRVLNLLYYVSPDWALPNGGNLELWPEGPQGKQITIESRFNRFVVMVTHRTSWHSVSPIEVDESRCCVSNYYFSRRSPEEMNYFHVTSFRGRPEQKVRDWVLRADAALRMNLRKLFPKGVVDNKHFYDKKKD